MDAERKSCRVCGGRLPSGALEGLCPACLLEQGLRRDTAFGAVPGDGWTPPPPEALVALFPELDRFELLGRGGMGAVYKARQTSLDRTVAVKILPPEIGRDPAFAERFSREARAMARLNHPSIVTVHEFGRRGDYYFFLMEFVDGASLRQRLEAGPVTPREALAVIPQICDALQYAHDQGVVHRDIKPDNILLDRRGRVKIADFGLAKLLLGAEEGDLALAAAMLATGRAVGTPQYMAPEQLANPREVDHRADIYSLGVVFYQLLTGELPEEKFVPPSRKSAAGDVRLDPVVERALAKEPSRRFQQMSQVKAAVETVAAPAVAAAVPWSRRGAFRWVAVSVLLTAGAGFAVWTGARHASAPAPAVPVSVLLQGQAPANTPPPVQPELSAQTQALVESVRTVLPKDWEVLRIEPDPKPVYRPRGEGVGFVVGSMSANSTGSPLGAACNVAIMAPGYDETKPVPRPELMTQMTNRLAEHPAQLIYSGPEGKILVWPRVPESWPTMKDDLLKIIGREVSVPAALPPVPPAVPAPSAK